MPHPYTKKEDILKLGEMDPELAEVSEHTMNDGKRERIHNLWETAVLTQTFLHSIFERQNIPQ